MARYYSGMAGAFWSPDPGGVKTAVTTTPLSWNRYGYTEGDPINFVDSQGLFQEDPCAADPTQIGCDPDDPPVRDPNPGGGGPSGGGGGGGPATRANPCSFGSLSPLQQGLMSPTFAANWECVDATSTGVC